MENFDDEFGDLSGYKILSFEEVSKGFEGNKNPLQGLSGIQNSKETETKDDEYINLNLLLEDIKTAYKAGSGNQMPYAYQNYFQDVAQTYIMHEKKHIDLAAKIHLKNGNVKVSQRLGRDKPRMQMFFDEEEQLTYTLTFRYLDTFQNAIELRTHSFEDYKNLLLYLGYGDVETDYDASTYFIKEFTDFLKDPKNKADDLYKVYADLPKSFVLHIHLPTETVVKHLNILTKEDDTGWFSWARDTTSLLIKVMGMFRKFQEASDFFWKNPKLLTEIYHNLDGHSEVLGQLRSNRILFASVLNGFAQKDANSKSKISKNVLLNGNGYFIESNILELNDTLNTIKGIASFDWDFDYKDAIFLQQKRKVEQNVKIVPKEGDPQAKETVTQDVDPGYLYHPMHLVHFVEKGEKAELVTALYLKAIADEKEWTEVMENIRIGGDILAIIAGFMTMGLTGNVSVLAIADIGLAGVDLALMNEDVKKWISDLPGGKWFVENWDTIYALVGAGIMSVVMIEGILTHSPALLEKIKNLKNVKGNYLIFTKQLEKLIEELQAYQLRNPSNVIEEVVLVGEKNGLLKKLLKLVSSPQENLAFIVEDIAKKGFSVKKISQEKYEIFYKGVSIFEGGEYEVGAFLKKYFWKGLKGLKDNELLPVFAEISRTVVSKIGNRELRQSSNNLDELYDAAKIANKELEQTTKKVARETMGKPGLRPKAINNGLKGRERALEKINSDYINPETKIPEANRLVDIAGSKIIYNSLKDLYSALEKFSSEYKILKIKDRIQKPLTSGYRDILMNIEMKNGHIVEFRLHLKDIDKAAESGHKLYQERRSLEAISTHRELTVPEQIRVEKLISQEENIYEKAWQQILKK